MFKKTILPTMIGLLAVGIYIMSAIIIPSIIIIIVSVVPIIGTIINVLMKLMFLTVTVLDLFYAASAAMITIFFITLCTKYDNKYPYLNAAATASGIAGTIIVVGLVVLNIYIISNGSPVLSTIASAFPYFVSGLMVAYGAEQ